MVLLYKNLLLSLVYLVDLTLTTITHPTHRSSEHHKEPSPVSLNHLEHSPPSPIKPRSENTARNYSAVNNLAILPDELRTPENLEHGQLAQENAQQMDDYLKKREEYEEAQLLANQPMSFSESGSSQKNISPVTARVPMSAEVRTQPFVKPAPGYEDIEPATEPLSKSAPQRLAPNSHSFEDISPSDVPVGSTPRIGDYNNPIDYLPDDHFLLDPKLKVGTPGRSSNIVSTSVDEYSEVFDKRDSNGGNMIILPTVRAMSDSKPARDGSRKKSSRSSLTRPDNVNGPIGDESCERSAKSMDNVTGDQTIPAKQSKRDDTKEVVELDFTKKRFRMASTKRSKENRDATDGGDVSPGKAKEDYAMVNLADKRCYRAESDNCKSEGSGIPLRYGPEATTPVVAVPT